MSGSGLRARAVSHGDVAALTELARAVDGAWWGRPETDEADVRHELGLVDDVVARSRVLLDSGGRVVGFAGVTGRDEGALLVSPTLDVGGAAVHDDLLNWLARAGARHLDAPRHDNERLGHLARHGFAPARSSFELELPAGADVPTPVWPDGIGLRPFDPDRDAAAVHALVYSVWTEVAGHTARSLEQWRGVFVDHERFDAGLQVVAVRGDHVVAVALCGVYGGTDGWVCQLAVGCDVRGLGLGLAALSEALRRLVARPGVQLVGLSVMASNERALGLYRGAGLVVTREYVLCERPPREAV